MAKVYRTDGRRHDKEHVAVEVMTEIRPTSRRMRPARPSPPSAEVQVRGALMEAGFQRFEMCSGSDSTAFVAILKGTMLEARILTLAEVLLDAGYEVERVDADVLMVSLPGTYAVETREVAA